MSITITVPNDDHVALRAMAKALEEIAVARGAQPVTNYIGEMSYKLNIDTANATAALEKLAEYRSEVDTTSQQVESLAIPVEANGATYETDLGSDNPQAVCVADSNGTPWDERIHSASKALNSDGTWRLRRKPKDMDEGEWGALVESVKVELDRLCKDEGCDHHGTLHECVSVQLGNPDDPEAPLAEEWDGAGENIPEPPRIEPSITPAGDDFHVDAGEVTEQQIAAIPVPPLPAPPVQQSDMTFPQVMQFLTERHGCITSAQVDDIIADMGLNSIMDLNTQPEHTGPFIGRVKALLGE